MTSLRLLSLAWQRRRRLSVVGGRVGGDGGGARHDLHRHRLQNAHHPSVGLARQRTARARELLQTTGTRRSRGGIPPPSSSCTAGACETAADVPVRARELTPQEAGERVAEVARAETVDERVDGRVAVAEPEEYVEQHRRGALATERLGQVDLEHPVLLKVFKSKSA